MIEFAIGPRKNNRIGFFTLTLANICIISNIYRISNARIAFVNGSLAAGAELSEYIAPERRCDPEQGPLHAFRHSGTGISPRERRKLTAE